MKSVKAVKENRLHSWYMSRTCQEPWRVGLARPTSCHRFLVRLHRGFAFASSSGSVLALNIGVGVGMKRLSSRSALEGGARRGAGGLAECLYA